MSDKDELHSCNKCAFLRYDSIDSWCSLRHNLPGYTQSTSTIDYDHCRCQNTCGDFKEVQVNQDRSVPDPLSTSPARYCPACGKTVTAMHFYFLAPKVLVYICAPCDAYYDSSLRALPNDEAALTREEYQRFLEPQNRLRKGELLRGRLAKWSHLEVTDGIDSIVVKVKPHRDLGYSWENVDKIIREFGGEWFKESEPAEDDKAYLTHGHGVWRVPK